MKINKLLITIFLSCSLLLPPFNQNVFADEITSINDQTLAKKLKEEPIDVSATKGWYEDKSTIFTTIYDDTGQYRGYKTVQIFKNGVEQATIDDYKSSAKNVCTLGEVTKEEVDYDNGTYDALNVVCMQTVGNENAFTLDKDNVTINPGYGKTDGYIVGLKVINKSFEKVDGGQVVNDTLFIDSNEGGSATLVEKKVDAQPEPEKPKSTNYKIILLGIGAIVVIIIIIIIFFVKKKKNKDDGNNDYQPYDNNQQELEQNNQNTNMIYQQPQQLQQPYVEQTMPTQDIVLEQEPIEPLIEVYEEVVEQEPLMSDDNLNMNLLDKISAIKGIAKVVDDSNLEEEDEI